MRRPGLANGPRMDESDRNPSHAQALSGASPTSIAFGVPSSISGSPGVRTGRCYLETRLIRLEADRVGRLQLGSLSHHMLSFAGVNSG